MITLYTQWKDVFFFSFYEQHYNIIRGSRRHFVLAGRGGGGARSERERYM